MNILLKFLVVTPWLQFRLVISHYTCKPGQFFWGSFACNSKEDVKRHWMLNLFFFFFQWDRGLMKSELDHSESCASTTNRKKPTLLGLWYQESPWQLSIRGRSLACLNKKFSCTHDEFEHIVRNKNTAAVVKEREGGGRWCGRKLLAE